LQDQGSGDGGDGVDALTVDTLVAAVCGDSARDDEDSDDEEDDDEEDEEEEENSDEDDEEESGEDGAKKAAAADQKVKDKEEKFLESNSDLVKVLMGEDEDDETAEATQKALMAMLAARKASKSQSSGSAQRRQKSQALRPQFQSRLRALDLLEQVARHHPHSSHLLGCVPPLVACVSELAEMGAASDNKGGASLSSSLPSEARDLRNRLVAFLKAKLLKCSVKAALETEEDADGLVAWAVVAAQADSVGVAMVDGLGAKGACPPGEARKTAAELSVLGLGMALKVLASAAAAAESSSSSSAALSTLSALTNPAPLLPLLVDAKVAAAAAEAAKEAAVEEEKKRVDKREKRGRGGDKKGGDKKDGDEESADDEEDEEEEPPSSLSTAHALQSVLRDYMRKQEGSGGSQASGGGLGGGTSGRASCPLSTAAGAGVFDEAFAKHKPLALAALVPDLPHFAALPSSDPNGARTPFLRSEAFRLLTSAFGTAEQSAAAAGGQGGKGKKARQKKRRKKSKPSDGGDGDDDEEEGALPSYSPQLAAALRRALPETLVAVCSALEDEVKEEAKTDAAAADVAKEEATGEKPKEGNSTAPKAMKQKRVRPVLECALAVIASPYYQHDTAAAASVGAQASGKKNKKRKEVEEEEKLLVSAGLLARLVLAVEAVEAVATAVSSAHGVKHLCRQVLGKLGVEEKSEDDDSGNEEGIAGKEKDSGDESAVVNGIAETTTPKKARKESKKRQTPKKGP